MKLLEKNKTQKGTRTCSSNQLQIFANRFHHICDNSCHSGQVVIIMLIIAMIVGIVIPGLIFLTQHEAKWTVKEIKSTRAFHLAEAGIDRGVFKLNESGMWDTVYSGTSVSGYNGGTEYSDVEGGYYKITFSTGSGDNEITIISSGKDKMTNEIRTIQAIYYKAPGVTSAITAASLSSGGNFIVHWGPIASLGSLVMSGSADNFFPRKRAVGQITCGTGGSHNHNDPSAGPPDSGPSSITEDEYKEWHDKDDSITSPDIKTSDYKTDAQTGGVYSTGNIDFTNSYNGGGGTYASRWNTYTTYYAEGNVTIKNCNLKGVIMCMGTLSLQGSNKGSNIIVTPHSNAWKEYVYDAPDRGGSHPLPDTTASGEYPGDSGLKSSTNPYTITKPAFQGFIYANGNTDCSGGPNLYGVVIVKGTVSGSGNPVIYFDYSAARNVKTTGNAKPTRQSWRELSARW